MIKVEFVEQVNGWICRMSGEIVPTLSFEGEPPQSVSATVFNRFWPLAFFDVRLKYIAECRRVRSAFPV